MGTGRDRRLGATTFTMMGATMGLWVAVGGCGGPTSDGAGLTAPAQASDFAAAAAHAICDNAAPCCQSYGLPFHASTCLTGVEAEIQTVLVDPGIAAGATYYPAFATVCLQAIAASSKTCDDQVALRQMGTRASSACLGVFAGTKPPGAICTADTDCAPVGTTAARCVVFPGASLPDAGATGSAATCVVMVPGHSGDPCPNPFAGDGGPPPTSVNDCGTVLGGLRCVNAVCVSPGAVGATCFADADCALQEYCSAGSCAARIALGEACLPSADGCMLNAYCDPATELCVARLAAGTPCDSLNDDCAGYCFSSACQSSSVATAAVCN